MRLSRAGFVLTMCDRMDTNVEKDLQGLVDDKDVKIMKVCMT